MADKFENECVEVGEELRRLADRFAAAVDAVSAVDQGFGFAAASVQRRLETLAGEFPTLGSTWHYSPSGDSLFWD